MLCRKKQSIWFSVVKIQSGVKVMSQKIVKRAKSAWNKAFELLENFIVWSLMLSQTTQAYGGVHRSHARDF